VRSRAWNRPFTVETVARTEGPDYYDQSDSTTTVTLKGDWTWRDQTERRGSPGGVLDTSDLLLVTDIDHHATLQAAARVVVDGIRCAIKAVNPFPDTGEVIVAGVRV
jgi:hypothetical protein